ncbi:DUF3950 domain-containing protein [Salmonella enterica subsp. enterica serovar Kottbus]|nr:hypothetical protein [Salmonella enterica subsp. enterica serovar Newport]EBY2753784.1 DUF3950 domain-containing protein [Salmonella enterica subsp. enterica serovar Kottbus]EHN5888408.1 DUF3950 domain-containing protein [Salmonella enterica subsp. enterica serovar Newport]
MLLKIHKVLSKEGSSDFSARVTDVCRRNLTDNHRGKDKKRAAEPKG